MHTVSSTNIQLGIDNGDVIVYTEFDGGIMNISELTVRTLTEQGITQKSFTEAINAVIAPHETITVAIVSHWVNGIRQPGYWLALHICREAIGTWLGDWAYHVLSILRPDMYGEDNG